MSKFDLDESERAALGISVFRGLPCNYPRVKVVEFFVFYRKPRDQVGVAGPLDQDEAVRFADGKRESSIVQRLLVETYTGLELYPPSAETTTTWKTYQRG